MMDKVISLSGDANHKCMNCPDVDSTHVVLWMGAYVCNDCQETMLNALDDDEDSEQDKIRIKLISDAQKNNVCTKFLEVGGNLKLKQYMTQNKVGKNDDGDKLARIY